MKTSIAVFLAVMSTGTAGTALAREGSLSASDLTFVTQAANANMGEIKLAKLALERSQTADVKGLAQMILDDHDAALAKLRTITKPDQIPAESAKTTDYERLSKLHGTDFDKQYARLMVTQHGGAIAAFKKAETTLGDPELKSYAIGTLPTLEKHRAHAIEVERQLRSK